MLSGNFAIQCFGEIEHVARDLCSTYLPTKFEKVTGNFIHSSMH